MTNCTIFLRVLRVLRGENWVAAGPVASLRTPVPSGRVLVATPRVRPGNVALGTRRFEQEKTERKEHHWTWSTSPFPLLPSVQIHVFGCGLPLCVLRALREKIPSQGGEARREKRTGYEIM